MPRVVTDRVRLDSEVLKQLVDNEGCKRWVSNSGRP